MRRAALVLFVVGSIAACGRPPPAPEPLTPTSRPHCTNAAQPFTAYDCDEGMALLVLGPPAHAAQSLEVRWGDQARCLGRTDRGGTQVFADATTTLAIHDEHASFTTASASHRCRHGERARMLERLHEEGALLFGVGNEPGWSLELFAGRFVWNADYGEARYEGPVTLARARDGEHRYDARPAGAPPIRILVRDGLCHDGMSDAPYGAEVEITRGRDTYRGCGLWLR